MVNGQMSEAVAPHANSGGRAYRRRIDKREAIRRVALQLFSEKGFDRTSLKDIARELGCTHSALYYYYQSKNEMLFDSVSVSMQSLILEMEDCLKALDEASPAERITALATTQIAFVLEMRGLMQLRDTLVYGPLSVAEVLSQDEHATLISYERQLAQLYRREVDAGIAQGLFHFEHPAVAVVAMNSAISNVVYWFKDEGAVDKQGIALLISRFCIDGLSGV